MTPADIASYVRLKTRTNSTTFTNADMLILANVVKDRLALDVLDADEDYWLVPTYLNLVADQREYPLHSNLLSRIKRVEAKLDGTNYIILHEFDLPDHEDPISTETNITYSFGNNEGEAYFDIMRKSIWIYSGSITSVTNGLKIWLNTFPADLTSMASSSELSEDPTTTTHGFPRELHMVLAKGIIIEWKESREKPIPLTESERMYDDEVRKAVAKLKKANYDREVIGSVPIDDGMDY